MSAKTRIKSYEDHVSLVPVAIPELGEVRKFAAELHVKGKIW